MSPVIIDRTVPLTSLLPDSYSPTEPEQPYENGSVLPSTEFTTVVRGFFYNSVLSRKFLVLVIATALLVFHYIPQDTWAMLAGGYMAANIIQKFIPGGQS